MANDTPTIFTIGHSTHSIEEFLALLNRHGITAIADVRSQPYGRLDHFNRENLSAALKAAGIEYVFLGQQLGARRQEPECYENGVATLRKNRQTACFPRGTPAIAAGGGEVHSWQSCARKRNRWPATAPSSIARCLKDSGIHVMHILADGTLKTMPLPRDAWSANWTSAARSSNQT